MMMDMKPRHPALVALICYGHISNDNPTTHPLHWRPGYNYLKIDK